MDSPPDSQILDWLWDKIWLFILAVFGGFLKITADRHFQSMDDMSSAIDRLSDKLETTNEKLTALADRVTRTEEWQKHHFEGK